MNAIGLLHECRRAIGNGIGAAAFVLATLNAASGAMTPAMGWNQNSLGANIHFTKPLPGEMEMIAAAGVGWVRTDLTWSVTERHRGVYDFSAYDELMSSLLPFGIHAVLILDYTNPLYDRGLSPYDNAGRTAFAKWATAAVVHFAGRGVVWEMYNEPDLTWLPKPNAENYARLALAVGRSLHSAAPGETYVGPALSYLMNFPFLEASLKAGLLDYWSAVSVHPYRQIDPESAAKDYAALRAIIARYAPPGKLVPVICTEWGYSTVWNGFNAERQGRYAPRVWLTNTLNSVPLTIWYDWRDEPPDPADPEEAHFGLVLRPFHSGRQPPFDPQPAYRAVRMVDGVLAGYRFARRISLGNAGDFALAFRKVGVEERFAIWTARATHTVTIVQISGRYRELSYLGRDRGTVTSGSHGLLVKLRNGPDYLIPERSSEAGPIPYLRIRAAPR